MISAQVICDSVNPFGKRLTTFKVRYPWFIHPEMLTHRTLSRNASSNRAIPLRKMLKEVRSDELRAEPVYWGAEQKGMEPGGELSDQLYPEPFTDSDGAKVSPLSLAKKNWKMAALMAAQRAEGMAQVGAHKSLCNRLLMPFTHANVIISATEWDNFFGLRLDKAADPTMRALAVAMWEARQTSEPIHKDPGDWHLPFADDGITSSKVIDYSRRAGIGDTAADPVRILMIRASVARCARVSYESFETGKRSTVEEDLKLYDRLMGAQPLHASSAEHQATPDSRKLFPGDICTECGEESWDYKEEHGNFVGFRQYRKMLPGESTAPLPKEYLK